MIACCTLDGICYFINDDDMSQSNYTPNPDTVPLGTGPPTREELLAHYPADFTWEQLKAFVNSGYVIR